MAAEKPKTDASPADAKAAKPEDGAASKKKSAKGKLIGIVAGVMIVEGVAVFAAMKMLGGQPEPTHAEAVPTATQPVEQFVELDVAKIRAPNVKDGKLVLWSIEVVIRAKAESCHDDAHGKGDGKKEGEGGGEHAKDDKPKDEKAAAAALCPELSKKIKMNERTIKDRLSRIIRSAEPQVLQEDGLETIRRQVKFELDRILEDEHHQITEVVIPECTPFPTGF